MGTAAARLNVTFFGFGTKVVSGTDTYSANEPWQWTQALSPHFLFEVGGSDRMIEPTPVFMRL
jgi:hypothetical protein